MAEKEKIQEVPEGWEKKKLEDIAKIISGSTPSTNNSKYWNGDIVWITPDDLSCGDKYLYTSKRKITKQGLMNSSVAMINQNSVVVSSRAPIGYISIIKVPYTTNQGCKSLKLHKSNAEYIYYSLFTLISRMKALGTGTTFQEITKKQLESIDIYLPISSAEQSNIAAILSTCDEAIEKTDAKIEKLKSIKQGLMQDLFRYGIDENGKMRIKSTHRFKDTPLGRIPEEWEVVDLEKVVIFKQGIQVDIDRQFIDQKSGLTRFLRIVDYTQQTEIPRFVNCTRSASMMSIDDVAVVRYGATAGFIGRGYVGVIANNLFKIICPEEVLNKNFLFYYLNTNYSSNYLLGCRGASAMPAISFSLIGRLKFILMDINEQTRIASVLSSAAEAIEKEEACKNKLLAIKRGLMEDLLSGKVRVNKLIREAA